MTVATGDSKAAVEASLDDAVDALLAQIDTACLETEQQLQDNDEPPPADEAALAPSDAAIGDDGIIASAAVPTVAPVLADEATESISNGIPASSTPKSTEPPGASASDPGQTAEATLDVATSAMLEDAAQLTAVAADFPQVATDEANTPPATADAKPSSKFGPDAAGERELSPAAAAAVAVTPQVATATANVAAGPDELPISAESIQALDTKLAINAALVADDAFSDGAEDLAHAAPAADFAATPAPTKTTTAAAPATHEPEPAAHEKHAAHEAVNDEAATAEPVAAELVAGSLAAAASASAAIPIAVPVPVPAPAPAPVASFAKPAAPAPITSQAPAPSQAPAAPQHATSQAAAAPAPMPAVKVPRKPILAPLLAKVSRAALKVVDPLVRPLLITNPEKRQTIAWVGTVTLFYAALTWSYALLTSPPEPGIPIGPQPTLHGPEEHPESKKIRAKAAEDAAKAAAAAAAAPPAAKDDGKGSGEKKAAGGH